MTDDTTMQGKLIAYRSTKGEGRFAKDRWTELAVWYDPDAVGGHCFRAVSSGCSSRPGEKTRTTALHAATLARALQHFDVDGKGMSAPARAVALQARDWLEDHNATPPGATYSEAQREAAVEALSMIDPANWGWMEEAVDAIAIKLGLQRATPRG